MSSALDALVAFVQSQGWGDLDAAGFLVGIWLLGFAPGVAVGYLDAITDRDWRRDG